MSELHYPGIAILASGSGSTAEAIIHATQDGRLDGEVGLVVCNKPPGEAGIYDRVERLNQQYGLDIETAYISGRTHPEGKQPRGQTLSESAAICRKVSDGGFALIALAGYMKMVNGALIEEYGYLPESHGSMYEGRMLNTHPGPLPETEDTYGLKTSELVIKLGLPITKHTVHLVSGDGIDRGPIVFQHPLDIPPNCSPQDLFNLVQVVEKAALPYAIDKFLTKQEAFRRGSRP